MRNTKRLPALYHCICHCHSSVLMEINDRFNGIKANLGRGGKRYFNSSVNNYSPESSHKTVDLVTILSECFSIVFSLSLSRSLFRPKFSLPSLAFSRSLSPNGRTDPISSHLRVVGECGMHININHGGQLVLVNCSRGNRFRRSGATSSHNSARSVHFLSLECTNIFIGLKDVLLWTNC